MKESTRGLKPTRRPSPTVNAERPDGAVVIVRGKRLERGFTIVDNDVIRDNRLSLKARALLMLILSFPDDWRTDNRSLARMCKEGETAIRSALRELRDTGYMVHEKRRDDRGRWITVVTLYDRPQTPGAENPHPENPRPDDPHSYEGPSTKDHDEDELSRADATHRPDEVKERSNWREADRQLWRDIIGQDVMHVISEGPWNLGTFTVDAFYEAFRKGASSLEARQWPGRYLDTMEDWEDWLLSKGVALDKSA